jgi:hypothetical protein
VDRDTITFEGVQILFRNFEGRETEYNVPGNRNFCVLLDDQIAQQMQRDGWNVKMLKPRDEGDEPRPYIQVAVGFKIRPPRMVMINSVSKKRVVLDEETCELLDWADILTTDLTIRARPWSVRGNSGIKAYLKTIFVIIDEDYLELKYDESNQQLELTGGNAANVIDGEVLERYELEA